MSDSSVANASRWARVTDPRFLLSNLTAGLVGGVFVIVLELSLAALIFSGDLSTMVGRGIGFTLFGAVVMCLVVALTSSFPGVVAIPQDSSAAILALMAASLVGQMPTGSSSDALFATVVAGIVISTVVTGILFILLGYFNLGQLARFVPYPVIGGFLAGTGWLLAQGGINTMTGAQITPTWFYLLAQPDVLVRWVPGLVFAVVLLLALRRSSNSLILPGMIVFAVIAFYAVLLLGGWSVAEASDRSWLLGPFESGALWQPFSLDMLPLVQWNLLVGQLDKIVTLAIVALLALLLNASGIELAARRDLNLNRELLASGVGNVLAAFGGAPAGYQTLGISVLGYRLGARSRLVGVSVAALVAVFLFLGGDLLGYFPRVVLGGLLLFLGLSFIVEWLYDAFFTLSRAEYALVVVIFVVVATVGYLQGVAVGVIAAVLLFVFNYSRVNIVKHTLSGITYRSNVDRPLAERNALRLRGEALLILQLQGYIFFGTAQNLLNQIQARARNTQLPPLQHIVLDFRRVSGMDSSAISSFVRLKQLADSRQIELVFTDVSPALEQHLLQSEMNADPHKPLHLFATLDLGVEWCEDRLLAKDNLGAVPAADTLEKQIAGVLPDPADAARLIAYMEKLTVPAGMDLFRQGQAADAMYFIETGNVSVELELEDGRRIRLRTIRSGSVVGEVGLYLNAPRNAWVRMMEPGILYRLDAAGIAKMEQNDPQLASALHKWIARTISERLNDNVRTIEALMG